MEYFDWGVLIMQIVVVGINCYIATTEKIKRVYLVTLLSNLANLIMYAVKGDTATALIYISIALRSFIYVFKDRFKTVLVPIIAVVVQLMLGFSAIETPWQLIPILVPCWVCIYMWFGKNTQQLRANNALCNFMWFIYNMYSGLYLVSVSRLIVVITNVTAFLRHRKKDIVSA